MFATVSIGIDAVEKIINFSKEHFPLHIIIFLFIFKLDLIVHVKKEKGILC